MWPPRGWARLGGLRRLDPVSRNFGFDRGTPVDRHYIESFLARHGGPAGDIRGRVLEVQDRRYADRFGAGPPAVERVDILDVDPANARATLLLDLGVAPDRPLPAFDCIICTQTLLLVYDVRQAVRNLHDLLAPGGVLLLTVPGISQICGEDSGAEADYWRFTSQSVQRLCDDRFGPGAAQVEAFGNVLTAAAFLYGLAAEELRPRQLDHCDPAYELIVAARATRAPQPVRPAQPGGASAAGDSTTAVDDPRTTRRSWRTVPPTSPGSWSERTAR